ncbi:sodium:solute symporter family protein [Flammeovirga sp. MY04]|uniref:sodium/pantothenate symporter n=1 Tax=Flammeovirga sp. MY04 TaxID=1191459 RepID=UPI0008064122|nr:sodium:solute symporter family protein [Flammeovirga sp. MY04]ANQ52638.1 sodium:solute symporter family protein [Flammeovirga sp. MY04]
MELLGWLCIVGYMLLMAYFAIRGAKGTKTSKDFALGSIHFSPVVLGLSLAASITSAATFIINPGFVAYYGLSAFLALGVFLPVGALVSLYFFTKKFRKEGKEIKALTMAQWIGKKYNNKNFTTLFAVLSLLLITFVVLICVGISKVIAAILGVNELPVLIAFILFVFTYVGFGGANSMVYTNLVQASLMIVISIVLFASGYQFFVQDISFFDQLGQIDQNLVSLTNVESPLFRDVFEVILCQVIVGIAVVCQPHIITKSLLIKKESEVKKYLWVAIITEILFFSVIFIGFYARLSFPSLTFNDQGIALDNVLTTYVNQTLPYGLGLFITIGLISAGLSTLEGLIQSLTATISFDLLPRLSFTKTEDTSNHLSSRKWVVIFLMLTSFGFSYQQLIAPDLSVGIFAQNGVYAYFSAAFIPVLCGLFFPKVNAKVAMSSAVIAIIVHFGLYYGRITPYMQEEVRNPGVAAAIAIITAICSAIILHLITGLSKSSERIKEVETT